MSSPFIAEVRLFGFNYAPVGWAFCQGQLLGIAQNTALFSLVGTSFGGNGTQTFALPNLQGRAARGVDDTSTLLGSVLGTAQETITTAQMPAHGHALQATSAPATTDSPTVARWAASGTGRTPPPIYTNGTPDVNMAPGAISPAGGGLPHNNMQPYLALNYCIALQGFYPSRN
jgi:microcystin-dependent protein